MDIIQWQKIHWLKRNEIIAFYGLRRSGQVKSITVSAGIDHIIDDGIQEADLEGIKHLTVEECLAFKPLGVVGPEVIIPTATTEPLGVIKVIPKVVVKKVKLGKVAKPKKKK